MAKKPEKQATLVELLETAGAQELAEIDAAIAAIEAELEQFAASRRSRLESLRAARKLLDVRINGRPARAKPGEKQAARVARATDLATRIHAAISEHGSMPAKEIANLLGVSPQAVGVCAAKSDWFLKTPEGDWDNA